MQYLIYKNRERGIGLIEVVAALGISIIVITSLVSLAVYTLKSSSKSNMLLRATKQANMQLELVRAYREILRNDNSGQDPWGRFAQTMNSCSSNAFCCFNISNVQTGTPGNCNPSSITLSNPVVTYFTASAGVNTFTVNVISSWKEGADVKTTTLTSQFTKWSTN